MPAYSQKNRMMGVATPLAEDTLLLETLTGTEAISELYRFELGLLADPQSEVPFERLLGQPITVWLVMADGSKRYLSGMVSRFSQGAEVRGPGGDITFVRYHATLVPRLWLLTRKTQSRIFQHISVPDILKKVLAGLDVDWQIQGTFQPRDYCTQYRETDFAFASRLMEEEGIYYYFAHGNGSHQMVVANTPSSHAAVPGQTTLTYDTLHGGAKMEDRVYAWMKSQEVRSGKVTLWDDHFELSPTGGEYQPQWNHLEATKKTLASVAVGSVTHKLEVGGNDQLELYDAPGAYAQRFDGINRSGGEQPAELQKIFQDNQRTTNIRMDQEAAHTLLIRGESDCRQLSAGHKFSLTRHFNANGEYVITRVEHQATLVDDYTGSEGATEPTYQNRFTCIPAALPYRPPQVTPKARVGGTQTALVVGPAGQEIFTDKYSRVKVQFPWDREGKYDSDGSCWCRVATYWAGKQWGAIHIPRIGQEVIVAFEEGDPDRPIIVGSVYNANYMPPYKLPDNATQSGIKTRSSMKGTPSNFNELRFEDKKGVEQVYFHAEKNFDRVVENNDTLKVGFRDGASPDKGDQTVEIFNNQAISVGVPYEGKDPYDGSRTLAVWNNQSVTIGAGQSKAADGSETTQIWNSQTLTVGSGKGQCADGSQTVEIWKDRTVTLLTGNDTLTVKEGQREVTIKKDDKLTLEQGNREVIIKQGNDKLTIQMGSQTTKVSMGSSKTEAMQSIELKVGQNSIKIDQTGITISGMMIKLQGQAMTQVSAPMTQVTASGILKLQGSLTTIN